jgi:hypothetical protein
MKPIIKTLLAHWATIAAVRMEDFFGPYPGTETYLNLEYAHGCYRIVTGLSLAVTEMVGESRKLGHRMNNEYGRYQACYVQIIRLDQGLVPDYPRWDWQRQDNFRRALEAAGKQQFLPRWDVDRFDNDI